MRADAKKNYSHILAVAREVVTEHGADASMRDIARRADVGLATLLRHFPTREALFEALLCTNLDALTQEADELERSQPPDEALVSWFREWVAFAQSYRGVVALMAAAHTNPDSALYASCAAVHSASARLLLRVQAEGMARTDINGGRPVRPDGGARLARRPALIRATGRSSGSRYYGRHPDKSA
ncbi:TetR family transcriptional regulator [Paraburkholderia sp. BL23I1N1]|nr:TetR family transcriptional regulator [Paraburkholderia sp. BL23I1N1]